MKHLIVCLFLFLPVAVSAQPYIGLQIGQSSARDICDDADEDIGFSARCVGRRAVFYLGPRAACSISSMLIWRTSLPLTR